MKKILSLILVLVIVSSMMITVFADAPTVTISTVEANPGDTVEITVDLTNNPGFVMFAGKVTYDSNLTINKWAAGDYPNYGTATSASAKKKNPFPFSVGDDGAQEDFVDDGTICTFTFVVSENATPGTTLPVSLAITDGTTLNLAAQKISSQFTTVAGGITVKGVPAPTTYTVTYNAGEGSNAPAADTNVAADTVIDLTQKAQPTAPSGKKFKGWSANGTDIITSLTVTGDVTLTALYEEIPVPTGPVLNGVATRLASSVAIDNVNHTVNVVYDTEQRVYLSDYVCFAPIVDNDVIVTYDSNADFSSTRSRLINYTITNTFGSTQFIDLLAEKNTVQPAIIGNSLNKADKTGVHNFNMTLEDGNGATTTYAVTLTIEDRKVQANNLLEGITAADFITERESDVVTVDTSSKVITLTTKNMYNYTTIAIDATKVGKDAIDTFALRPRRTMQLLDADSNAKYMGFRNEEVYNKYDRAILLYYENGTQRSYTVRIFGGSDGLSYEDYTLTVAYVPSLNVEEDIKIGRIHNLANAIGNSVAEINKTGKIQITYDPTKSNIVFSPIYAKGYHPSISGDEGKVITERQDIAGFVRDVYTISTSDVPSALKYNVRRVRDTRVYDFEFLNKNN